MTRKKSVWPRRFRWLGRTGLMMVLAAVSAPRWAHAKFDPRDPLGELRQRHMAVSIEVAPGDWGRAQPGDIQRVLASVAEEFLDHVGLARDELKLRVIPRDGSPRVLYERGVDGQYVIQLTARDDHWFQYAYQFSHELCHVVSNFDHKARVGDTVATDNQWFEESLCETAALFTLLRLGDTWQRHPPSRNWIAYAPQFPAYANHLLEEPHRQLPSGQSLREWYGAHRVSLRVNPYLREKNEVVASALLPLFVAHPEYWRSIAFLNADPNSAAKPFSAYLADWYAASPDKTLPAQVMTRFGFVPAARFVEAAPPAAARSDDPSANDAVNGPAGD